MKPKLLVVGDSFMHPDPMYPGQHWSEMLPEYEVLMYSVSGSSNAIIAKQFYQGMNQNPDAVVLGFTAINRVELMVGNRLITGSHSSLISNEQRLLSDLYQLHVPEEPLMVRDCSVVRCLLEILENKKIPYAWSLSILFNNLATLPYPSDPWVKEILSPYFYRMTPTNLATYPGWKASPGYHTDDPEWQKRFSEEVNNLLKMVDFL